MDVSDVYARGDSGWRFFRHNFGFYLLVGGATTLSKLLFWGEGPPFIRGRPDVIFLLRLKLNRNL